MNADWDNGSMNMMTNSSRETVMAVFPPLPGIMAIIAKIITRKRGKATTTVTKDSAINPSDSSCDLHLQLVLFLVLFCLLDEVWLKLTARGRCCDDALQKILEFRGRCSLSCSFDRCQYIHTKKFSVPGDPFGFTLYLPIYVLLGKLPEYHIDVHIS